MAIFKNVNVVQYHVKDWERAKKFYSEILEWPVCYSDDSLGWMEFGRENETHVAISRWQEGQREPGTGTEAIAIFSVEDAFKATEFLRTRGVKCDDAVNIPRVVCFGTCYDPDGNRLQFSSDPR